MTNLAEVTASTRTPQTRGIRRAESPVHWAASPVLGAADRWPSVRPVESLTWWMRPIGSGRRVDRIGGGGMTWARHLAPINSLRGTIEQRFLVNYRIDPDRVSAILPPPFTPELVDGYAIGGICIIQLKVGPRWLPRRLGFRSHNGAHRIAVTLPDGSSAVYVPQRHSNSRLNTVLGGRLFPGVHRRADITPIANGDCIGVELTSRDGLTDVTIVGTPTDALPESSVFDSVDHVSRFFEQGSFGYSDTRRNHRYDGLELRTKNWAVTPLAVDLASSTFFDDLSVFPADSTTLDNALIMRNIDHTWHRRPTLRTTDDTNLAEPAVPRA